MASYIGSTGLTYLWNKIKAVFATKQDTLVSGTNIKTINSQSLLGSGDISISGAPAVIPAKATWDDTYTVLENFSFVDGSAAYNTYVANGTNIVIAVEMGVTENDQFVSDGEYLYFNVVDHYPGDNSSGDFICSTYIPGRSTSMSYVLNIMVDHSNETLIISHAEHIINCPVFISMRAESTPNGLNNFAFVNSNNAYLSFISNQGNAIFLVQSGVEESSNNFSVDGTHFMRVQNVEVEENEPITIFCTLNIPLINTAYFISIGVDAENESLTIQNVSSGPMGSTFKVLSAVNDELDPGRYTFYADGNYINNANAKSLLEHNGWLLLRGKFYYLTNIDSTTSNYYIYYYLTSFDSINKEIQVYKFPWYISNNYFYYTSYYHYPLGDANIIESISVNGTALTPDTNKAVDITVPTESTVSGWGFTKNAGTITGVNVAGVSKGTSGVVDVGVPEVNHGTSDTTFTLIPNVMHIWGTVTSLTLSLPTDSNSYLDEYLFTFTSGSTPTTLSLPSTVKWVQDIEIEANKIYQVSIINNLAGWLTNGMPSGGGSGGGGENNVIESISVNGVEQTVSSKNVNLQFKTINNNDITGTGNITIQGGGSGEENVIETVKVNGTALTPDSNKAVDVTVPTESTVTGWGFTKNTGTYSKPSGGIPKTDLATAVQTSLGLADTALQSYTETDPTVPSWAKASSKPTYTASEVGALPDTTVIPTESTVSGWGFTKNAGTITGITMNGSSKGTSGVVNLGTVITSETSLSKGSTSGSGNAVTDLSVSGHTITLTKGSTFLTSETSLSKGTTTGSGNAVTDLSVSGHTITLTKGTTFLTSSDVVTIYSGSSAPSSGTGSNGDIYIQTS